MRRFLYACDRWLSRHGVLASALIVVVGILILIGMWISEWQGRP